jgi:hypothetical protein
MIAAFEFGGIKKPSADQEAGLIVTTLLRQISEDRAYAPHPGAA